jgi:hypothetical protein
MSDENRLLAMYGMGSGYQPGDAEDATTENVLARMARNQQYGQSPFGKVHAWLERQGEGLEGASAFNPIAMALEGSKSANRWAGSVGYPEQVQQGDMLAPLGLSAMAAPFAPVNALGSLVGKLSHNPAHVAAIKRAEEMAAQGAPREDIWRETLSFQAPDGHWKHEIDDSKATVDRGPAQNADMGKMWQLAQDYEDASIIAHRAEREAISVQQAAENYARERGDDRGISERSVELAQTQAKEELAKLADKYVDGSFNPPDRPYRMSEVVDHPELMGAYPDLGNRLYKAMGTEGGLGTRGAYDPGADEFYYSKFIRAGDPEERSTGLHELKHGVEKREGWSTGSSPEAIRLEIKAKQDEVMRLLDNTKLRYQAAMAKGDEFEIKQQLEALNILQAEREALGGRNAHAEYKANSAEAEARAVQARRYYDPAVRQATPFWKDFDIPEDKQRVEYNKGLVNKPKAK